MINTDLFENDVNMYGTQAGTKTQRRSLMFENDVNMYGTQAMIPNCCANHLFENDVNMYGTQAATSKHFAMIWV